MSYKIVIPAAYRQLLDQIRALIPSLVLGTPMNLEIRGTLQDVPREHRFDMHFQMGVHVSGRIMSGRGHYGRYVDIQQLMVCISHEPSNRRIEISAATATLGGLDRAIAVGLEDMENLIEAYGSAPPFGAECTQTRSVN